MSFVAGCAISGDLKNAFCNLTGTALDDSQKFSHFSCLNCAISLLHAHGDKVQLIENQFFLSVTKVESVTWFKSDDDDDDVDQEAEIKCMQPNCGRVLNNSKALSKHLQNKHNLQRTVKCPYCHLLYHERNECNIHIDRQHKKRRFVCGSLNCLAKFVVRDSLKNHIFKNHSNVDQDTFCWLMDQADAAKMTPPLNGFKHV
jgi:uncharacterized Zn-finger protein